MKITALKYCKNSDRVSVYIDGKYAFSLTETQIIELGIKSGVEVDNPRYKELEMESQFGKVYQKAMDYCFMRPRSIREIQDYLRRTRAKNNGLGLDYTNETNLKIIDKLISNKYLDDEKFAKYWINNRSIKKGVSKRKLYSELIKKGVEKQIIDRYMNDSNRDDKFELKKVISRKRNKYPDKKKFIQYLMRLGFCYDDINEVLNEVD